MTKMKITTHKRLQYYEHHYGMVCLTGMLGCRWHRYQQSQEPSTGCDISWYILMLVTSLFTFFWFYFWLLAGNSWNNLNWFLYDNLGTWRNLYAFIFISTSVVLAYVAIINILALCHLGHGHQVHIHWIHKVIMVILLAAFIIMAIIVTHQWSSGWLLQKEALMITGPFLHLGAVILMTGLSWFVAAYWISLYKTSARIFYLGTFISVMVFLYAIPVLIESPCITDSVRLPRKPFLVGHRGLPSLTPENTKYSFMRAANYVITWESDVTVSFDGVPYLMHDATLKRTTNVDHKWPEQADLAGCWFNMSQIQILDAGSWFLESDPFNSVSELSEAERMQCINQTVPTLEWFLRTAQAWDMNVMFDIKNTSKCQGHPYFFQLEKVILGTIFRSGIDPKKVWWLTEANKTNPLAANLTQVLSQPTNSRPLQPARLKQLNITIVNVKFGVIPWEKVREYKEEGIGINIYTVDSAWLYSLYWCMGIDSITTNQAAYLSSLTKPVWILTPQEFRAMWIATDFVSAALIVLIFVIHHLCKVGKKVRKHVNSERLSLQGPKIRMSHLHKNRNMKEKLLHTVESFPDIDPASLGISNEDLAMVDHQQRPTSHSNGQPLVSQSADNSIVKQSSIPSQYSVGSGTSGISAISGNEVGDSSFTSAPPGDSSFTSVQLSDSRLHMVLANDADGCKTTSSDGFTEVSLEAAA